VSCTRPISGAGTDTCPSRTAAAQYFERIGSETMQRVNAEFANCRQQFNKTKLRWRVSKASKRSLGWIPFKAAQLQRKDKSLRFAGKAFRVFEQELLDGVKWKFGCFALRSSYPR